ncbi:MAG: hypothetical protein JXA11_12695 [Phycisphaerae bacterium]|nr:hypothetical protein [Phycisphaerae bacterium]
MNFFREHLFMVLLTTCTIVLCLILVFWSKSINTQIDEEEVAARESLSKSIEGLSRPPFNNGNTNAAEQNRVDGIRESLQKVKDRTVLWNRRNFTVPELKMIDGSMQPAFPFDMTVWAKNFLANRFLEKYHGQLDALKASLHPAEQPTEEEIDAEAVRSQKILEQQRLVEQRELDRKADLERGAAANPRNPAADRRMTQPMPPDMDEFAPIPEQRTTPRGTTRGTTTTVSAEARQYARETLTIRKAQEGEIYVEDSSFSPVYPRGISIDSDKIDPEKFWKAQVGLWVRTDIVGAIHETIQDVQKQQNLPEDKRNVITSPVKRLLKITVGDDDGDTRSSSSSPRRGLSREMDYPMGPEGPGGYHDDPRLSRRGQRGSTRTVETPVEKPDTLTQNAACKLYDVVDYSFTVLMPTRYLPLLEENLLKRNYHVILNMQIEPPDAQTTSSRGGRAGGQPSRSGGSESGEDFYYGVEPLRKVTIEGQLLLMTGFTRGLLDEERKNWINLPLMPVEVMKNLPSAALRPEDQELTQGRLQPRNPAVPEGVAPTPGRYDRREGRSDRYRRPGYNR